MFVYSDTRKKITGKRNKRVEKSVGLTEDGPEKRRQGKEEKKLSPSQIEKSSISFSPIFILLFSCGDIKILYCG